MLIKLTLKIKKKKKKIAVLVQLNNVICWSDLSLKFDKIL